MPMKNPFSMLISRLSVGRKLMLIYLLDLCTVIFVSGILINEKYIAIDFARKELAGNAYIAALRQPLLETAAIHAVPSLPHDRSVLADAVRTGESRHGADMDSAGLNAAFANALDTGASGQGARPAASEKSALTDGRELLTRIGNASNLILDPDLDSYYTMSLILLRYPELLETTHDITAQMQAFMATQRPMTNATQTRYFILEGRLDAVTKGIESDFVEAFAGSSDGRLKSALDPQRARLLASIDAFRTASRAMLGTEVGATQLTAVLATDDNLLRVLDTVWMRSSNELDRLLDERVAGFFHKMWLHLGTALFLLCLIFAAVTTVARQIAVPLRRLLKVAESVVRDGDRGVRAEWSSTDEIGRLVRGFNGMLDQLASVRGSEREFAATARAAVAQRELVESLPIPMMVTAIPTHEVLHANELAQAWIGAEGSDPWAAGLDPTVRSRFFQRLADEDAVNEFEVLWKGSTKPVWALLSARRLVYQGRAAVVTAFTPISRIKLLEQRLGLWAKVFEASSESIMIVGADHRIRSVNLAFSRSTAHDMRDVIGESPDFLLADNETEQQAKPSFDAYWPLVETRGAWQGEVRIRRRDLTSYPAWMVISAVRDATGSPTHFVCTSLDISERKASQERISFLAQHDALTGLPNRSLCTDRLRDGVAQAVDSGERIAVLFLDLDHFKTINDSLGHHIGDGLLRSVSRRLLDAVRTGDTVSRLGGDEFVVVLRGVGSSQDVLESVENRLVTSIRRPHVVAGVELQLTCSVGIAIYPDDASGIDELMRRADVAMYQAKILGRDSAQLFTTELDERAQRKLTLQSHLRQALDRAELSLHYQPKIDASDRSLVGVEALLRWNSAGLGPVAPVDFIGVAEETRQILPIGAWVVGEAIRQHAQWKADGYGEIPVSINVSVVQLRSGELVNTFRDALRLHGVAPSAIEIELTESTLMDSQDGTLGQLLALKDLGIKVSVDDFGTGYSSLTYLNRFPVDTIKIDRSFISNLLVNPADFAITRAIIGLGHALGLTVIAEGVETEEVALALKDARCDFLQGYYFSRPLTASKLVDWLDHRSPSAAVDARLKWVMSEDILS